ncbi:uncharacterized protein LOC106156780 [Lingula anatina]|uniref:Uncharacterized protein LOC106156780 n=1 Tax=Lingula anatina TaxID=7574 RepID=A0A1S3HQ39_LINAN|nr:uncharacterized protein LOC106156780 [Lingula anatina]|eukprot:XP_013387656.1 uncharacterized protein LOC106156780 [Lingula anatina]
MMLHHKRQFRQDSCTEMLLGKRSEPSAASGAPSAASGSPHVMDPSASKRPKLVPESDCSNTQESNSHTDNMNTNPFDAKDVIIEIKKEEDVVELSDKDDGESHQSLGDQSLSQDIPPGPFIAPGVVSSFNTDNDQAQSTPFIQDFFSIANEEHEGAGPSQASDSLSFPSDPNNSLIPNWQSPDHSAGEGSSSQTQSPAKPRNKGIGVIAPTTSSTSDILGFPPAPSTGPTPVSYALLAQPLPTTPSLAQHHHTTTMHSCAFLMLDTDGCSECISLQQKLQEATKATETLRKDNIKKCVDYAELQLKYEQLLTPSVDLNPNTEKYQPSRGLRIEQANFVILESGQEVDPGMTRLEGTDLVVESEWLMETLSKCTNKPSSFVLKKLFDGFFTPHELASKTAVSFLKDSPVAKALQIYGMSKLGLNAIQVNAAINSKISTSRRCLRKLE